MYEFDRSTPVTVALRLPAGSVEITAEERLTVEVDVQPEGSDDAARDIRVALDGDTLLIQAPEHSLLRRASKARIVARVPAGSALTARTVAASVRADGLYSTVQVKTVSAGVEVGEATGDVQLEAASGDLAVARAGGSLRVKNVSGELRVGDVTGDVNVESASGDIRVGQVGGSARATSASGDIEIGRLRRGQADLRTVSGDVQAGVAAGSAVWMDLNTLSGRSITDLTAHGETPPSDEPVQLELRVRTMSGDIRIHRAAGDTQAVA